MNCVRRYLDEVIVTGSGKIIDVPLTERRVLRNLVSLFVYFTVIGSKEHFREGY